MFSNFCIFAFRGSFWALLGHIGLFWGWGRGLKIFLGYRYIHYQFLFSKYRSSLVLSCSFEFVVGWWVDGFLVITVSLQFFVVLRLGLGCDNISSMPKWKIITFLQSKCYDIPYFILYVNAVVLRLIFNKYLSVGWKSFADTFIIVSNGQLEPPMSVELCNEVSNSLGLHYKVWKSTYPLLQH